MGGGETLPEPAPHCPGVHRVGSVVSGGGRWQGRAIPLSVRPPQICVGVGRTQGLVRVTSGRKRGLVPAEALTEI